MYLSKLILNRSRAALLWTARPYRVHQRLCLAFAAAQEPRLLFRIEAERDQTFILVQSHSAPDWAAAFADFPALAGAPTCKPVEWPLRLGQILAFRLRANPTARKHLPDNSKKRVGLNDELEQLAWLGRKAEAAGFRVLRVQARQDGLLEDTQTSADERRTLALLSVQFDGALQVVDPEWLQAALASGIGSAKGLGFGLLSLAPLRE
jgi:CRISPR system Cascade subunit CasE